MISFLICQVEVGLILQYRRSGEVDKHFSAQLKRGRVIYFNMTYVSSCSVKTSWGYSFPTYLLVLAAHFDLSAQIDLYTLADQVDQWVQQDQPHQLHHCHLLVLKSIVNQKNINQNIIVWINSATKPCIGVYNYYYYNLQQYLTDTYLNIKHTRLSSCTRTSLWTSWAYWSNTTRWSSRTTWSWKTKY